eukprot:scaffold5719_cov77-Skeletonema_dohrnii-CCMP3373.AAC.1
MSGGVRMTSGLKLFSRLFEYLHKTALNLIDEEAPMALSAASSSDEETMKESIVARKTKQMEEYVIPTPDDDAGEYRDDGQDAALDELEEGVDGRLLDLCLFREGLLSGIRSSVSPVVVALH